MVARNPNISRLAAGYLFPEIAKRKQQFLQEQPDVELISLGIGDTTEPIPESITHVLQQVAGALSTPEGYSGYGEEQGMKTLREKIAQVLYHDHVDPNDLFINDGAKCDLGRLQAFFGPNISAAIQDPSYPVYVDGTVITGNTGSYHQEQEIYDGIVYMTCNPENNFFPDLSQQKKTDLIYFCSPNNPTGVVATHDQLHALIEFAKANQSIIIFDAAYMAFIQDPSLPHSIYEIEGAKEVAIEINSFSKTAGFTGVRLGWTIVPKELKYTTGESVKDDWYRFLCTTFNGASNIAQMGGLACLEPDSMRSLKEIISLYLKNASILKQTLEELGYTVYSGDNAPYLWVDFKTKDSWQAFEDILRKTHVVTTPGCGFGPGGEGFIRFSAFGKRETIEAACQRLRENLH